MEEVSLRAGRKVLMEDDGNSLPIVVDLQGILDKQFRAWPIHLSNITIILIKYIVIVIVTVLALASLGTGIYIFYGNLCIWAT